MPKTPIVRPVSWLNAAINISVLAIFVLVGWAVWRSEIGVVVGAFVYVVLSQTLRRVLCRHQRMAIGHCRRNEFEQAIPEFERSLAFFRKHEWVDRFRAVTLLSAAGMCYREMALVSLGFSYSQIGDGANARRYYEMCMAEFPDNGMAEAALRLMDAAAKSESVT